MKIKMKKIKKSSLLFPNYIKIKRTPLRKLEYSKEITYKEEETRHNMKYRPINPPSTFNPSSIGINEILKKNNLSLITNNTLKNIIIKFREERQKELEEKKVLYKNKSFHNYEEEKKRHFIMLKALLRKDHQTIQNLILKENKTLNKKENRCSSGRNLSYLNKSKSLTKIYRNKSSPNTLPSYKNLTHGKISINKSMRINKRKEIWNEECLPKLEKNIKKYSKKYELKIKNAFSVSVGGKPPLNKMMNIPSKKYNQDSNFSLLNITSEKLGEICLFGVLDGNGPYGKQISSLVRDYIIDYFKNGNEMKVTLKRDNFYSIMYNSFVNTQKHLIENIEKSNINIDYSGVTGCILLYPLNNTNKIYCANLGRSKCLLYTMFGTIRLSYELYPERASEKYRISLLKKKNDKIIITSNMNEEIENLNKNEDINISDTKNTNSTNEINKELNISDTKIINSNNENNKEKEIENLKVKDNNTNNHIDEKDKENYLKDILELDISRCIGNLAAQDYGIIPGPEVVESDIRVNRGKFIVMGTSNFWKYLTDDEVGEIVNKYLVMVDSTTACKELIDISKERWKSDTGGYEDISVSVIFFDMKNLDAGK